MPELAQRITASHKAAAKRAAAHLARTRKLKLSATESLELVASVMGVANWQTLLAMAREGRGPRIDDGQPQPAPDKSIAQRLAEYFEKPDGTWGEHPDVSREDWAYECDNGNTRRSYWEFVEAKMDEIGEMPPWERDASFAVILAKAAGIDVELNEDEDGWTALDPLGFMFLADQGCEKDVWEAAAADVERYIARKRHLTQGQVDSLTEQEWLALASEVFQSPPEGDHPSAG